MLSCEKYLYDDDDDDDNNNANMDFRSRFLVV